MGYLNERQMKGKRMLMSYLGQNDKGRDSRARRLVRLQRFTRSCRFSMHSIEILWNQWLAKGY
ncbi:hypothetical protein [Massilia sp. X63]|uniref:hypothetical protein n=1 Tax=Massilia sp. X63 TaxID=3237285 RepID=UPI0034DD3989